MASVTTTIEDTTITGTAVSSPALKRLSCPAGYVTTSAYALIALKRHRVKDVELLLTVPYRGRFRNSRYPFFVALTQKLSVAPHASLATKAGSPPE
ncbi:hypothetical protein MRX96_021940 [Rhipicephalus microplus]